MTKQEIQEIQNWLEKRFKIARSADENGIHFWLLDTIGEEQISNTKILKGEKNEY